MGRKKTVKDFDESNRIAQTGENTISEVGVDWILRDSNFQVRSKLDPETIRRYASVYASGGEMPPVKVAQIGDAYVLVDGWHRVAALERIGKGTVKAVIVQATKKEALWMAAEANLQNGLPLKSSEIRYAFRNYIRSKQYADGKRNLKSFRQIAMEIGGLRHYTTIRNWMREDFPKLAARYSGEEAGPGGLRDKTLVNLFEKTVRDALKATQAAFKGVEGPARRGQLIKQAEDVLAEMKAGEPWKPYHEDF